MEKCSVDGKILHPCDMLNKAIEDNAPTNKKGLVYFQPVNVTTLKPTRSIVIAKSGEFAKEGLVLKFCPFCGEDIFSHWDGADSEEG